MTHPCDTCPNALPGRYCAKHDSPAECRQFVHYQELEARNRRLGRICERNATLVTARLAMRRAKEKNK
jgi:hypothetical protein